ncbi:heparanase-like isoform X3 [Salvelinus fontinalis]|uniref:heparanase-like isoform X3 n=1 Tax=Salvelinus fontinalis TaxID=8038 RepID=UPI0024863057|nr:heparanase-like isoform X3 [Salvelinus fontinalis]
MSGILILALVISILSHGYYVGTSVRSARDEVNFESVNLNVDLSRVLKRVNERFLSVAIDASLVAEEKFMYLLASPKLRTLAKALSPAFLRFGGTRQDFMTFNPAFLHSNEYHKNSVFDADDLCERLELPPILEERLKQEWALHEVLLQKEDLQRKYQSLKFTEPNSYEKKAGIRVNGYQLGQDFIQLRRILRESKLYHDTGLYGPDISQPRDHRRDLLEGFLESGAEAIDACTWHHYYVNGRHTSLKDFLDPEVLNTLALKTHEVIKTVDLASPGKKVWLGETSSAYGGGAKGLSDTFVAGFMWLDKLGLGAKLGLDVVIRQVLIGSGTYHLVDDNLDPLPDYWLSVLYKRLVGPEVLSIEAFSILGKTKRVRVYLHCTNKKSTSYKSGAITLFALNLSKSPASIAVPAMVSNSTVEAFVLQSEQPGEEGLYSKSVKLNGEVLKMVDDRTLPSLQGTPLAAGEHLRLPGYSFAFYLLSEAQALACR